MSLETSTHFLEIGPGYSPILRDGQTLFGNLIPEQREPVFWAIDSDTNIPKRRSRTAGFIRGNASQLPFQPGTLDLIVAKDVFGEPKFPALYGKEPWLISIARKFVIPEEAARVLKPGGKMVIIENNTPNAFIHDIDVVRNFFSLSESNNLQKYHKNIDSPTGRELTEMLTRNGWELATSLPEWIKTSESLLWLLAEEAGLSTTFMHGEQALSFLEGEGIDRNHLITELDWTLEETYVAILGKPNI